MQTTTLTTDNIKELILKFAETGDYYFIEQIAKIIKIHESHVYHILKEIDIEYKNSTPTKKALLVTIAEGRLWKMHHKHVESLIRKHHKAP